MKMSVRLFTVTFIATLFIAAMPTLPRVAKAAEEASEVNEEVAGRPGVVAPTVKAVSIHQSQETSNSLTGKAVSYDHTVSSEQNDIALSVSWNNLSMDTTLRLSFM